MRKTAAQNFSNFIGGVAQNENGETGYDSNALYGQFRQEVQNSLDQNIYLGENGNAEGKYWVRNPNMNVSTEGMRPEALNALDMLGKYYFDYTGKPLILNAGTNGDHAAGEFSHANGWKFDIIDQLEGDGALITANYGRGSFLDQFIKYGRSLGLGMNFEGEGTQNVHLDVAVDGTQWDGNGDHAGGFNPRGANVTSQKSSKQGISIDNFMRAIGQQESDGNYDLTNTDSGAAGKFQIMPDNWSSWAQDAGLSPDAPMTPENQELVARNKMQEYYNKFGNWRDVAIAWYGGEGAVSYSEEAKNRPQYSNGNRYPSINEYADSVMARFEKFGGEIESSLQWNQYRQQQPQQQEQTKPPFDINVEDETTQKLLEQFAREKRDTSEGTQAAEDSLFFEPFFTDKDVFKNTAENLNSILKTYGDEFRIWAADKVSQEQIQPQGQPQTQEQIQPQIESQPQVQQVQAKPVQEQPAVNNATPNRSYGNTAEVITGSRKPYQIQYRVVEASELNTSHEIDNGGVFANKNYPSELQPRNRERANMQAQVISMSNNLNPADLMDARDVNQGAPVIRNDGVVLNGNGRTAAIRYAYKNGNGDAYKNSLIQNAEKFGLSADEISKMNQPVLLRELAGDLTAEDLQDITTTQTGGAIMGASEKAQSDARKLSADTLAIFPQNDNADLTSAGANDFLQSALRDIATPDELNSLTTSDGQINQDGINRVKRALFALAYDDGGLISRMSESTDDNVRGATNALLTAAPAIAKVRAGMKNGTLHSYDLSAIAEAVKKLSALRDQNKTVANYLQEQSLFGEDSAEMKEILSVLDRYKRAPNKIAAFLKKTASNIQEQGDPRQGSLFGENEPAPLIDLITRAKEEVENNGQTTPMFSRNGEVDTRIDNIVDDKDLTPQQKLQQDFGKKLGVQTIFFNNENGDFHGAHANGTSYINVNSKMPIGKVFWHEAMHWLKANNPKLYQRLVEAAGITDAQRDAYLKETGRTDLVTDEEIDEEILADKMEDVAKRSGLLQSIAGKNRGLIQRVMQWLKDTMNKFIDHFRNPSGKLTTKQSIALADEFGRIAKDLVDPNGQKIFRYNNRTQNVELADGRGLNAEAQTKKALADLAKAAWNDKNFNGKVSFTPSKKFRDKAQELFGHDIEEVFITGSDIRHIKKKHGANEDARGQIDMTLEMIPDIYDVVNDFDIAEEGKTDKVGQKAIEVTKNINGGQGYVITVERGTKKAEVKTALKRKKPQVLDTKGSEQNVRNDPATSSDENIPQGEDKIKYSIGNSDNEHSWLKGLAKKLGKALHLNGDKIITEEDRRKAHLQEQEKAMADYLKDPSKDNKYRLNKLGVTKGQLQAYKNESKTIQCAIRTETGYIVKDVVISDLNDGNDRFKLCKTSDGTFTDEISFTQVTAVNSIFYVKGSSVNTEQPQTDHSVKLRFTGKLMAV